jgi:stearoyl-CoA desaturase (delta-9 desaturase)
VSPELGARLATAALGRSRRQQALDGPLLLKFHRLPAAQVEALHTIRSFEEAEPMEATTGAPRGGKAGQAQDFTKADGWLTRTSFISRTIYWGIHASCLLVFWVGAPAEAVALCAATYAIRVFGITGGYHRYFAHKTYKTSRVFQFVLAWIACSATQKGPLWWAGTHRRHHRYSDLPGDPHSPKEGVYYSHQGWIFDKRWQGTPIEGIRDFAEFPELVWLNNNHWVPPLVLAVACYLIGGFPGLLWGMAISTTLLWHGTYSINSLAHLWGTRRYETTDTSRNNPLLALLTFGEGWHNNHHYYMASVRQGFFWYEIDITYYILRALQALGVVWDLKLPSKEILEGSALRIKQAA